MSVSSSGSGVSHAGTGMTTEIREITVDGQVVRVGLRRHGVGGARIAGYRVASGPGRGAVGTGPDAARPDPGEARPPLLIFNGIGANLELLEPFTAALGDIDTVVFDVPGVGGSPAPRLPYRFWQLARMADHLMTALGHDGPTATTRSSRSPTPGC